MKIVDGRLSVWLPAVTTVAGVSVFAATLVTYFNASASGAKASYIPLAVGTLCFVLIVGAATHVTGPDRTAHPLWTVATSFLAAVYFGLAVLFVLLNTLGS